MSSSNLCSNRMRLHGLATATAVILTCSCASAFAADRIDLSGLASAPTHDRFIVKYRDGSAPRANAANMKRALDVAAAAGVGGRAVGLQPLRSLSVGGEVVRADRKLDRAEAEQLMRQIATDPNVEFI